MTNAVGSKLSKILDMNFYEKAHFVKADVAATLCG